MNEKHKNQRSNGAVKINVSKEESERFCKLLLEAMEDQKKREEHIRTAIEKATPMEVTEIHCDEYVCPRCGSENLCDQYVVYHKYCPQCGQALETEGEE